METRLKSAWECIPEIRSGICFDFMASGNHPPTALRTQASGRNTERYN